MTIKGTIITIIAISLAGTAAAQEVVTGPSGNPLLRGKDGGAYLTASKKHTDTLELPFYDDFTRNNPWPDSAWWADYNVYINNTFTVNQLTMGVATFDLLDSEGRLYESASEWGFPADVLTSRHINLNYPASDSIWLSFLYQPGGIGDAPEAGDSLTLQFWSPVTGAWVPVWKTEGTTVHPFRQVMIPVTDDIFLKKGFRFRFRAWGSLSQATDPAMKSSGDNWHIDCVRLGRNREYTDTVLHDVAFTLPVRSLLKNHEQMPLRHFRQIFLSEMGSFIPVTYLNNDTITRNVTRQFEIRNLKTGAVVHSFSGGAVNTTRGQVTSYSAPLFFTYPTTSPDTISYEVKNYLITDLFDRKENDTIKYTQHFANTFAWDDGTAEAGYGINGQGSRNAMVAVRFRAYVEDSLRAVAIAFNDSYLNSNLRAFDIAVWDNNGGTPGNLIYLKEEVLVEQGEGVNGFYLYVLDDPVYVDNIFFVGWRQRSETFLNAGLDLNTPHLGRQYYWLNGSWYQSDVPGSLMVRAVTGPRIPPVSVGDITAPAARVRLYPNPADQYLNIDAGDLPGNTLTHTLHDLSGRVVMSVTGNDIIDISRLRPGIYIVVTSHRGVTIGSNRLIKAGR